ncbi:MAG: type II toxin-antitoxin system HicB family antitoxin [Candidatus Omnitrophica bacterium]|nr:type II toxin-antitoxin system HicB family antitoxin [Candidatus Omnitrophota bacterium]
MKLKILVEKGKDGYFVAHCPSLKSCWSQGKTEREALKNIKEAVELYMEPELGSFKEDADHKIYELAI